MPTSRTALRYQVFDLALEAADAAFVVAENHQAYEVVEKLLTPDKEKDSEHLPISRVELGALLRTLNRAMRVDIQKLTHDTTALFRKVDKGDAK